MMKRYLFLSVCVLASMTTMAQDTYESARLLGSDLNGTARYVGMGGAMEALGADISVTGTNPAGIGLFRHSTISASMGVVSQQGVSTFDGLSKTNVSIDQLGFVWSMQTGDDSYFNFAVNYHKTRNFDRILTAANRLNGSSLNKLSYMKNSLSSATLGGYDLAWLEDNGKAIDIQGYENTTSDYTALTYSQMDYLNANYVLLDDKGTADISDDEFFYSDGSDYSFDRAHRGWINAFDFTLSGNIDNSLFLGLTVGFHDVNYHGYSHYTERLVDKYGNYSDDIHYYDDRKIKGTGLDVKVGAIFRPIEDSPFRFGAYIITPTWYDLKTTNSTEVAGYVPNGGSYGGRLDESYRFKLYTPWKFGLTVGHTISNYLALGATYEYSDNSAADIRTFDEYRDSYGNEQTSSDRAMNNHVEKTLRGVSTLKVGAELKPDPKFAVRLGYNLVSPMYKKEGMRDMQIDSEGVANASTYDYTNWQATHRITCGMGYKWNEWSIDLAYQYGITKGEFFPFQRSVQYKDAANNLVIENQYSSPTAVDFKRHQVLMTVGYTF